MTTTITIPPIDWFRDPSLPLLTPLTVTREGRVLGHLCEWGTDHIGMQGRIRPPRSHADYRWFHTGVAEVSDGDQRVDISVGKLTTGTGHADTLLGYRDTSSWYDNTGSIVATVCAGEDAFGVWVAGSLLPDVEEATLRRFRACGLSGDWRRIDGSLELVAALSVPTGGFPVPRARVASGAPQALVAAGIVPPVARFGKRVAPDWSPRPATALALNVDALADRLAERIEQRRMARELSARHSALVAELDDTPAVVASLLAEVDDSPQRATALLAELEDGRDDVSPKVLEELAVLAAEEGLSEEAFISRMPPQLRESYLRGEVAARIRWNTPGDFTRCVAQARKHGMGRMAEGACANLHHAATGMWPGDRDNQ